MNRLLFAAVLGAASFAAVAQEAEDKVRAAIQSLVPGASIDSIADAAMPGFYEVVLGGQIVYVSADGKYLLQGSVYDIPAKTDLTEASRGRIRVAALEEIPSAKRLVFAPKDPKHTVTVFTDIDCGYCRRLHQQMAEYNELGIAVEYLFFPRSGPGTESWTKAESVWCAEDPLAAMTAAKAGEPVPEKTCANPVDQEYAIGRRIGVNGTPAVITADGTQIGGYVPPQQMLARLDELAAKAKSD